MFHMFWLLVEQTAHDFEEKTEYLRWFTFAEVNYIRFDNFVN